MNYVLRITVDRVEVTRTRFSDSWVLKVFLEVPQPPEVKADLAMTALAKRRQAMYKVYETEVPRRNQDRNNWILFGDTVDIVLPK